LDKRGLKGLKHKKLQNLDSIQLQGGPKGTSSDITSKRGFFVSYFDRNG